ncbi:hypothetical protein HOK51_07765 [Candidatus Woesearchaeota archaeon]|jgi:hypothetical protein|nr:hypothetical protein [Candidatus Woesearchaeota archaeon]MBT6519721.1 hypothetical protein [Candidatus Woesearchaeota archaeon]MBT7368101.1 hypothetical protein [Candidatus Woesearchaeota archaeon]
MIQTNLSLKKLNGIKPKGVKVKQNSRLEELINYFNSSVSSLSFEYLYSASNKDIVENVKTMFPNLSESDLDSFIFACCADKEDDTDRIKRLKGKFTGVLLSAISSLKKEGGSRADFYFDGFNVEVDYLFKCANGFDSLIVENIVGNEICCGVSGGKSTILAGRNIRGMDAFAKINCDEKFGFIYLENTQGYQPLEGVRNANIIILKKSGSGSMAKTIASWEGDVDLLVVDGCNCQEHFLYQLASYGGHVKNLIVSDTDVQLFMNLWAYNEGRIDNIWFNNVSYSYKLGASSAEGKNPSVIGCVASNSLNSSQFDEIDYIQNILIQKSNPKEYELFVKSNCLDAMLYKSRELDLTDHKSFFEKVVDLKNLVGVE